MGRVRLSLISAGTPASQTVTNIVGLRDRQQKCAVLAELKISFLRRCRMRVGAVVFTMLFTLFVDACNKQRSTAGTVVSHNVVIQPAASPLQCITAYALSPSKFGLQNNCDQCKLPVYNWNGGIGIRRYRVEPHDYAEIDIPSSLGQPIGEESCH